MRAQTGESVEVQGLYPDSTIGELKAKLETATSDEELHLLKFKRSALVDDDITLASIGIRHDVTIIAVPKPKAKAKAKGKAKGEAKAKTGAIAAAETAMGGNAGDID